MPCYGKLDWKTFVQQTIDLVTGPLGERLSKERKRRS